MLKRNCCYCLNVKHTDSNTSSEDFLENVIKYIEELPDKFSLDELFDKLLFIHKVETALEQSKNNQVTSHEEVVKKFDKWLK